MQWQVETRDEFAEWFNGLSGKQQARVTAAIVVLQRDGPMVRRPLVGKIEGSRHANMKELIPPGGNLRILFAFDPERQAILLLGGDKTDRWIEWYRANIPIADERYDQHLAERAGSEQTEPGHAKQTRKRSHRPRSR